MTDEWLDDDELQPPDRPDFRRVGRGIPYPVGLDGKRVRYGRPSNAGKILDDESNLTDWKLRTVVAGAAQRPELLAQASVLDIDSDKKALRDIAEKCLVAGKGQRRAIIGDAVHAMFDHLDRQDDWKPPPNFYDLCDAYEAMKEDWGLEPVAIEVHVINDEFRLAGRIDRIFGTTKSLTAPDGRIVPIGSHIFGDHKTGKELEYAAGSYATQLAAYVDSVPYDVANDERGSWDFEPIKDWALIIHADSAGTTIDVYWVDIESGRNGLRLAREVKAWRRRDDLLTIGRRLRIVVPDDHQADDIDATDPPDVPTVPADDHRATSRYEWLRGRVQAILGHSDIARQALARSWPVGVAGLKSFNHSMHDMDAIELGCDQVEKDHSVPFYPLWDDPDMQASIDSHPSNRWAKPNAVSTPATREESDELAMQLVNHPRSGLVRKWLMVAINEEGIDSSLDQTALSHALYEFAMLPEAEWPDDDLTTMLDGCLRAIGYPKGIKQLGRVNPEHGPIIMSAAFAITAGQAMLLFDDEGNPIVRTNIKQASKE